MKFICVCAPQCPSLSPLMIFALKSLFCKSDNITSNVVFHHFRLVLGASGIRHTQAHKRCTCLVNSTRATCTFLLEGAAFLHTLFRIVCKTPFNAVRCLKPHESGARGAGHSELQVTGMAVPGQQHCFYPSARSVAAQCIGRISEERAQRILQPTHTFLSFHCAQGSPIKAAVEIDHTFGFARMTTCYKDSDACVARTVAPSTLKIRGKQSETQSVGRKQR